MSRSSKNPNDSMNIAAAHEAKNKLKQRGQGNDSMTSSKRVVKDEKNTSNQRSRST